MSVISNPQMINLSLTTGFILPTVFKILEKCIHSQITSYLEKHKLFSQQFVFRKIRSTELLVYFTIMNNAIYVDLSKACDHSSRFDFLFYSIGTHMMG